MGAAQRWTGQRALFALALVLLAFSPVLLVLTRPPPNGPAPMVAPALPEPEPAPGLSADTDPQPGASSQLTAPAVRAGGDGVTAERAKVVVACPREKVSGGQYNRCLYDVTRTSEQALEAELANAFTVIEARTDLQGTQRARWKTQLDEAQSRFLLFRNLDCQGVAPFEGPRGIGNFEQRSLCLIAANRARAADLKVRYGAPQATSDGAKAGPGVSGPSGPAPRPGAWTHAVPPPLE